MITLPCRIFASQLKPINFDQFNFDRIFSLSNGDIFKYNRVYHKMRRVLRVWSCYIIEHSCRSRHLSPYLTIFVREFCCCGGASTPSGSSVELVLMLLISGINANLDRSARTARARCPRTKMNRQTERKWKRVWGRVVHTQDITIRTIVSRQIATVSTCSRHIWNIFIFRDQTRYHNQLK